ncbi:hypothetical protein C4D60_Mb05t28040 [Musa balbisiana]|uniref:Diacylglycerol kinase n=1 Tax=Musa balbisiana TaxID=52838 RepID=A0A4V4H8H9_MUSBA|nr:hypothetical protein C4D60_Mb05t28040 [Musa balbisiana]
METGRVWTSSSPVIYPSVYSHTDGRIETGRLQYEAIQCLVAAVAPLSVANAPVGKWSADRLPYLVLHAFSDSNRGRRQNRAEVLRLLLRSRVNPSLDKPPRSNFMGHDAVFDLGEEAPDKVLHRLYANFEKLKSDGDRLAVHIERTLRLIVAGGDGTAGWLLGVVCDLKLAQPPPIATVPLGTGNNLPFSFGWGKKNPGTNHQSVKYFLDQVKKAKEMQIDSWHIVMRMRDPKEGTCDPIAPLELPHSLHAFHRVSRSDSLNLEGYHTFRGGFWNYFSMGMDAQVSYAFHSERKLHPEKFKNQIINQTTYAKLGATQGWFFASLFHPSSRNIAQLANVKIMRRLGHWEDLRIPRRYTSHQLTNCLCIHSIRSIVCLNLPSFSGGLNPWGTPNQKKARDRDLTPPYVDDGLLEARRIRFEFHKGATDHTFMRIDGEPWKQPLPVDDDTVVVEISHLGQVKMLATHNCISKSIDDPSTPSSASHHDDGDSSPESDDEWEGGRRKFGAAETFKIPEDTDIAHVS